MYGLQYAGFATSISPEEYIDSLQAIQPNLPQISDVVNL
jgi:hypothetical protein